MFSSNSFLRRFFRLMLPKKLNVDLSIAFGLVILLLLEIFASTVARAGQATVTVNGHLLDGVDTYGTFIGAGGDLTGYDYTLVYTIDDQSGISIITGSPPYASKLNSSTTAGPADAAMTINSKTIKFSDHAFYPGYGVPSFGIGQNSAAIDTQTALTENYTYVGNAVGSAHVQFNIAYTDPVYSCDYNWETNFTYLAATSTVGYLYFG